MLPPSVSLKKSEPTDGSDVLSGAIANYVCVERCWAETKDLKSGARPEKYFGGDTVVGGAIFCTGGWH